ncbi:hypothetical protein DFH06DRAFT_1224946 [Mycena polygramma]|nr:hypothetical protein DFH06DRAFT_1224946 [Mycena polygramma]
MSPLCPPVGAQSHYSMNLQTDAVRLYVALQSQLNPAFLGAALELLSCGKLPPAEFRRHSRKIVRLIETARDRLEASGVSLYLFTNPSCQKGKWKDVYFQLLRMLQAHRSDIDETLQARANSLLVRLCSNFVGRGASGFRPRLSTELALPEKTRRSLAMGITTCTPQPQRPSESTARIAMPPPDAFPPSAGLCFRRRPRRQQMRPFLVSEVPPRLRKRGRIVTEQENKIPTPDTSSKTYAFKPPPLTKRFGIFCTGKNSMHQPWSIRAH